MKAKFAAGDKVFAKVRGYPYWPAKVVSVPNSSKVKYDIIFYGTGEKATVKGEDVQSYLEKKNELGTPKRQKAFNEAMSAIENDILPDFPVAKVDGVFEEVGSSEDVQVPVKKKSVGRPKQSLDTSEYENPSSASTETKESRGRKRKSKVNVEPGEKSFSETSPEVTKSGRRIKVKKLSTDSPLRSPRTPTKRKQIDKLEDKCSFDLDGDTVSIVLNTYRPPLNCPKSMLDWNRVVMEKACQLKEKVLEGSLSLEQAQQSIDEFSRMKAKDKRKEYDDNEQEFKLLKVEGKLLQLDVKIKSSLTLNKANPSEACKHFDEFLSLPITPLMLKKHPEIVETFRKLNRYVGNTAIWTMSDEEKELFHSQAEKIRQKSQQAFEKVKSLFDVPDGQAFSFIFAKHLRVFSRATEKLSQEEFFSLVKEPDCVPE